MNSFVNGLNNSMANVTYTANGAVARKSTNSAVYDMFAFGGAYRNRSNEDCILLFKKALEEDETLALKCLFYLRDARGGQGERRFFRVCYRWLADNMPSVARRNFEMIPEYGRYDDVVYTLLDTYLESDAMLFIKKQLALDIECKTPSLLAKWLPSENASSSKTKKAASKIRSFLGMTHREYRKTLSVLRKRINIVERLMSANEWDKIEFDKIPSKAGLIYKNAFARRDIIAKKYETFTKDKTTKVNATTLYPYDVVSKALETEGWYSYSNNLTETDRAMIEKYWENLPDYLEGKDCKMLCVVDTSASMRGCSPDAPINVAISLGMYCAERVNGPFKNCYISFSANPQFIKIEGVDFVDKVRRIYKTNLCQNTDLMKTFALLRNVAQTANPEDIPEQIVVISDMQIDAGTTQAWKYRGDITNRIVTDMEMERARWEALGLKMPKLIYWNVNASKDTILDASKDVSCVSGMSPTIFKQVITGVTGYELMLRAITAERYAPIA